MKTISIEGVDGSGKTFFINLLKDSLLRYFERRDLSFVKFPSSETEEGRYLLKSLDKLHTLDKNIVVRKFTTDMIKLIQLYKTKNIKLLISDRSYVSTMVYRKLAANSIKASFQINIFIFMNTDFKTIKERNLIRIKEKYSNLTTIDKEFTVYKKYIKYYCNYIRAIISFILSGDIENIIVIKDTNDIKYAINRILKELSLSQFN